MQVHQITQTLLCIIMGERNLSVFQLKVQRSANCSSI